jgi:hypothetical protein
VEQTFGVEPGRNVAAMTKITLKGKLIEEATA